MVVVAVEGQVRSVGVEMVRRSPWRQQSNI